MAVAAMAATALTAGTSNGLVAGARHCAVEKLWNGVHAGKPGSATDSERVAWPAASTAAHGPSLHRLGRQTKALVRQPPRAKRKL
jgi:hypothetical protein